MKESIDLRQLRYFLAVSEELNFSRAAIRLHISQPPLSRQIKKLEEQLGADLFVRTKQSVVLTKAGQAFVPEVRKTLEQAQKAISVAQAARTEVNRRFLVGYTTVFDRSAIPDVLDELQVAFQSWRITTNGKRSISLVQEIKAGRMDAAFIGLHTEIKGLVSETVFEEPLIVALPAAHPLAQKSVVGFDDLCKEPMFWFERRLNPGFYDYCQAFFSRIHFKPSVVPEPQDHHVLLGLIAEGRGFALISKSLEKLVREGVVFKELVKAQDKLSMGIAVVYSPSNQSPVLRKFLELVRSKKNQAF